MFLCILDIFLFRTHSINFSHSLFSCFLGGTMSVFLMGVYDKEKQKFCTVTKCGNGHDDSTLDRINKELEPKVINILERYWLI